MWKGLDMGYVMTVVNFIRSLGLNHPQFRTLLEEEHCVHEDVPYHTDVRWLIRGKVLRLFFDTLTEIAHFMESKQSPHCRLVTLFGQLVKFLPVIFDY